MLSSARMLENFERSWMQLHPSIHNTSIPAARRGTQFIPPASAPIYFFDGPLGPPQAKVRRAKFDSLFYRSNKKSRVNHTPTIMLLIMLLVKYPVVNCIHVDSK